MKKSMEIVFPENAMPLSMEEMRSVEGGSVNVPLSERYLDKNFCRNKAGALVRQGKVVGMTNLEIAQELYAHAVVKYNRTAVMAAGVAVFGVAGIEIANKIYNSAADGAYIDDYGDSSARKTFYSAVWNVF